MFSKTVLIFKNNSSRRMYLFISACDIILKDLLGVVGGGPTLPKPIVWKNHLDLAADRRATSLKNLESTGRHSREMPCLQVYVSSFSIHGDTKNRTIFYTNTVFSKYVLEHDLQPLAVNVHF